MRLRRVGVRNYRSIVDSGIVDIEDRATVLIGKNEQDKPGDRRDVSPVACARY